MTKRHQHLCICSFVLPVLVLSGDDFLWNVLSNQDLPTLPLVTAFLNVHWKYHYATCTAAEPEIHPSASLKVANEDCTGVRNLWILTVKYRYKYARCCLVCAFYCHRHMWHYSHSRATNLPTYNPGWDRGGMWCDLGCKGWFWAWQRVQVHFCICLIKEQFLKKWFQKRFLGDSVSCFNIHFQNVPCFNTIFLYLLEPAAVEGPLGNPRNCIPLCELLSRLGMRHLHLPDPIGGWVAVPWKQIQQCANPGF